MIIFYLTHSLSSSLRLLYNRTNKLDQDLEDVQSRSVPSFNPLSSSPVRGGSQEWPTTGPSPPAHDSTGDGRVIEVIEEDTRHMDSADAFIDVQPRRVTRKAPSIEPKSMSTKVQEIRRLSDTLLVMVVQSVHSRHTQF